MNEEVDDDNHEAIAAPNKRSPFDAAAGGSEGTAIKSSVLYGELVDLRTDDQRWRRRGLVGAFQ